LSGFENLDFSLVFGEDWAQLHTGGVAIKPRGNRLTPFGVMRGGAVGSLPSVFILIDLIQVYGVLVIGVRVNVELQAARLVVVGSNSVTHGGLDEFSAVSSFDLGGYE
jgi:hypothetical protein